MSDSLPIAPSQLTSGPSGRKKRVKRCMKKFLMVTLNLVILYTFFLVFLNGFGLWRFDFSQDDFVATIILFGVIVYVAFRVYKFQQRRLEHTEQLVNAELDASSSSPSIKALVVSLRRRARFLRATSWITLFLSFLAIAFGLLVFTRAGEIAQRDILSQRLTEELYLSKFRNAEALGRIQQLLQSSGRDALSELEEIKTIRGEIERNSQRAEQALRSIESSGSNGQLLFFLSTVSTRLGSVLILIFLVQILLSVYRYSVRLVSYYDSRADALLLYTGPDADQLQKLVSTLSAERVEFGKSPTTPAEQATELIKSVASLKK